MITAAGPKQEPMTEQYRLYGYRWVVLALFMFVNLTIQMLWIAYAPITGPAASFYGAQPRLMRATVFGARGRTREARRVGRVKDRSCRGAGGRGWFRGCA